MPSYAYIALAGEDRVAQWELAPDDGALAHVRDTALPGGPSPLAVDPAQRTLYVGLRAANQVAALYIDPADGALTPIGVTDLASDPCYLATDRTGAWLFSAYYRAGAVAVHPLGPDGAVRLPPAEWRVTAPHAHALETDPSNRWAFVPHVAASNTIMQFRFDAATGHLQANDVPAFAPPAGTGPRHYCFHPLLDIVYVANEQGSSVTAYRLDTHSGTLSPFQSQSTLPPGWSGANTCAQIRITPQGDHLYVANRGHDSIACFGIDRSTGKLTGAGQQHSQPTPRAFNVDPTGQFLLAAGLDSGKLTVYRVRRPRGTLDPLGEYAIGSRPMWVLVLTLPV
ncbi:MAG: lactonase family protein [Anaerolineae bacterium]|nr:lactonase family protein [Anaerolineae bacterium]